MRRIGIEEYLRRGIDAALKGRVDVFEVVGANEFPSGSGATVRCAAWTTEGASKRETERSETRRVVGNIVVETPVGEGPARLDAILDALERFFRYDGAGGGGFTAYETRRGGVDLRAAAPPKRRASVQRAFVYVVGTRRNVAENLDGRYQGALYVDFDVYEEE